MKLISSQVALRIVVALSATPELTLSGAARAVDAVPSAAQRALALLRADGLVERAGDGRARYRLATNERVAPVRELALADVPFAGAAAVAARANEAVELVARRSDELIVVFTPSSALAESAAARFFDLLAERTHLRVRYLDHDDIRRELLAGPELRREFADMKVLYGSFARTFPDRSGHGARRARLLHRPHRALRSPSRSFLWRLLRRHRLEQLALFGSAVRSDFRPDSDVDVLVRYAPDARPSLASVLDIERELERAFGRDVDVVVEDALPRDVRDRIASEQVPLV